MGFGSVNLGGTVETGELVDSAVTYAKIQNVSATDKLLGRSTVGAGVVEEIACTAAGRAMLDDANAAAQRTTLGIGLHIATVAAGTAYSLTNSAAALDFGTTDPVIVLTAAGTYQISGFVNVKYNGATFAANQAVTIKLRRTNNTAADLTNGAVVVTTAIVTTLSHTFATLYWEAADYTTANTDDSITIFGDVAVAPAAGSLDVIAACVKARRIA